MKFYNVLILISVFLVSCTTNKELQTFNNLGISQYNIHEEVLSKNKVVPACNDSLIVSNVDSPLKAVHYNQNLHKGNPISKKHKVANIEKVKFQTKQSIHKLSLQNQKIALNSNTKAYKASGGTAGIGIVLLIIGFLLLLFVSILFGAILMLLGLILILANGSGNKNDEVKKADNKPDQYIDVVYLKNGSIIKGLIIEQIPNVSLKIQTKDGSVFVYKMEEVEKMTKEIVK